jgi:hypothetical protein
MKNKVPFYVVFLLLMVVALNLSGCSKLFGPSDQDVIKAVNESEFFKGGVDGQTLQLPIVILEKGDRNTDGSWPVKVKVTFTYYENKGQISAPVNKTLVFKMYKDKDSTGQTIWKAKLGS